VRLIQRIVGACLTLLAGVVACVFVLSDKISDWRERRRSALTSSRIRAEIKRIRQLADQQRDAALHRSTERKTPMIVILARIGLMLMACAVAGVMASRCSDYRPLCHWRAHHRNTLTERINGEWVCEKESANAKRDTTTVSSSGSP